MGVINKDLKLGNRDRMIRTCLNRDIDRQPFWFMFGPWYETVDRWKTEGMKTDDEWRAVAGFDEGFASLQVNLGFCPTFEWELLETDGEKRKVRDERGITLVEFPGHASIPEYLEYPIKTREDWEVIKRERLNPDSPERIPEDWHKSIQSAKEKDAAIQVGRYPYGLFGTLRDFMGAEELLIAFYDDPELIREMMDYLTDFWIAIYERVLKDVQIDHIHIWEDMSGKNGPLISPAMFKEFMTPNYKKIVEFAKRNNIQVVSVDTDGNMDVMMPLLEESGINLVLPFEVQAGCDVVEIKKNYPGICLLGGIDKRQLTMGRSEIDKELDRINELYLSSGYIPMLDHLIHPEISYENYLYFIEKLKLKIGL